MSPRETHYRSAELARKALDTNRIPHFTVYGLRDNVLFVLDGKQVPVITARFAEAAGGIVPPAQVWTKAADYPMQLLVDPDHGVVELRTAEDHVIVIRDETAGVELSREARRVWNVQRLLNV